MWLSNRKISRTKGGGEYVILNPLKDRKNIRISRALAERLQWTEKLDLEIYIDKEKVMLRVDHGAGNGFPFYPASKEVKSMSCQFHAIADTLKRFRWAAGRYAPHVDRMANNELYLVIEKEAQPSLF
jgi:hypothetical protein